MRAKRDYGFSRCGVSVGDKISEFEVLELIKRDRTTCCLVRCSCGTEKIVRAHSIKSLQVKSCGCKRKELISSATRVHGLSGHPLWSIYNSMRQRCKDESQFGYKWYGAKGIKVCDRWLEPDGKGFLNFLEDMGERPEGMTLGRIDPEEGYSPCNCQWKDRSFQSYNTTMSVANTSGVTGVGRSQCGNKWIAYIGFKGKSIHLGTFLTFQEAITARYEAEVYYFGNTKCSLPNNENV